MATLADIPFYGGYVQQQALNRERETHNLQQATGQMGLLQKIQEQQQQAQVRDILQKSGGDIHSTIPALMKVGPVGMQVAGSLAQLAQHQSTAAQAARESAVFSPENIARNTSAGTPARTVEGPTEAPGNMGPGMPVTTPAVPGQVNMDALRRQAAMTGAKGMEAYSTHQSNEENRRLTIQATAAQREATLQQAKTQAEMMHEFRLSQLTDARSRAIETARHNRALEGIQGQLLDLRRDSATRGGKPPSGYEPDPDKPGALRHIQGGPADPLSKADKPMTEFQGKAALYGTRAAQSDKVLKSLEDKISLTGLAAGQATGMVGNALMSSEQQRVSQAQRDFVNAVLRQESGAVISDAEFANAKQQYFPAPGDNEATIRQKRANRQLAIKGFARMSGPKGAIDIDAIIAEPLLPGVPGISPTPQQAGGKIGGYVEMRKTADGRTLGKKADGTIEEIKQ